MCVRIYILLRKNIYLGEETHKYENQTHEKKKIKKDFQYLLYV